MTADEDAEHLRERLAVFAKVMFIAFLALRLAEVLLYVRYLDVKPTNYSVIVGIGAASLVVLASAWFQLARRSPTPAVLARIDLWMMSACGTVFGLTGTLAWSRPESAYTCLIYGCFMVFTRAIVVPSSARRTVVVSAIAMFPLVVAAFYLAIRDEQDVPGRAFFAGGMMYAIVAVAVAATGSRVIYGLRREAARLERAGLELGKYALVRKVGDGPIGEVFVARHMLLRRPTAIKLVQPSRGYGVLARCERAVQEMSQLRHHNTVAVYDYGRSPDGAFYVAMEYLEGLSLDVMLERYGAQPPARAISILLQLCAALHEAHARGFAHGNIKAANVIVCERGGLFDVAKLTDFGLGTPGTADDDLAALANLAASLLGDSAVALPIVACFASATSAKQLAFALRALEIPPWTSAQARTWWAEHRRTSAPFLQVPTTLSVDLGRRAIG